MTRHQYEVIRDSSLEHLTWLITMGLLDTSGRRCSFTSSFGCELLTRGLATS